MHALIIFIAVLVVGFILGTINERRIWILNCNKTGHRDLLYRTVKQKPYFIFDQESLGQVIHQMPVNNPAYQEE